MGGAAWLPTGSKALVLDTETTGVNVHEDRIVTACAAVVEWTGSGPMVLFQRDWLLAVEVDIPDEAAAVHGVTTAHAREYGMPVGEGVREIANAVRYAVHSGYPVVAYNAAFDLSLIDAECARHGLEGLVEFCGRDVTPVLDPYVIDKQVDRFRPGKRQLEVTAAHYGVTLNTAHTADGDVLATAHVLDRIAGRCRMSAADLRALYADRRYPMELVRSFQALARLNVEQMHAGQVGWYRSQSEGLAEYWRGLAEQKRSEAARDVPPGDEDLGPDERRQVLLQEADELVAKAAGVDTVWPIRSLPAQVGQVAA